MDTQPFIRIENVTKTFGEEVAVNNLSLDIGKNELFSLLGASGCGKTTLLRMIAGFEKPTSGRIIIDGVDLTNIPPFERPVNTVFQSYALFPHMTVEQNVAFGLKQEKTPKSEIEDRVASMLKMVELEGMRKRKPHQMSGGQRQRVALARALIKLPKVLLLDEPLAALDKKLRERTQFELVNIQELTGITFIMVTHDQEEAMTMSSRIGVMNAGMLQQVGTPSQIYEYPHSRYVADFIGEANIFEGILQKEDESNAYIECRELGQDFSIKRHDFAENNAPVAVMIRPEKMRITLEEEISDELNSVAGTVKDIAYLGDMSIYHVELESGRVLQASQLNFQHTAERKITWGDEVLLYWHPDNAVVLAQ
ncbi:ABC transporter ATP-binding protein [Terasakiella pusilla]|uniref:ABC transporter ATP-binding protein n=1 Tax=Terasakiella pusilla TaxID=64973 RepID=UPI000AD7818C|nr:ABC transporter ATP-binding protein [Terasakiella pusilla]